MSDMGVSIERFSGEVHLQSAVQALLRVREADPTYPPPVDVDADADSFSAWLTDDPARGRWVALDGDEVMGHIMVVEPHRYLTDFLDARSLRPRAAGGFLEIGKFFVDPRAQRRGVGKALFLHARSVILQNESRAVLAVVETSGAARDFYARLGMRDVGSFSGRHGKNLVFMDSFPASHLPHHP